MSLIEKKRDFNALSDKDKKAAEYQKAKEAAQYELRITKLKNEIAEFQKNSPVGNSGENTNGNI